MMTSFTTLTAFVGIVATASAFFGGPCNPGHPRPLALRERCRSGGCAKSLPRYSPPTTLRAATADQTHEMDGIALRGPLTPIEDTVVVEVEQPKEVTDGGIFIPLKKDEKPTRGTVVAVGGGKRHYDSGALVPTQVQPGERVVYGNYDGTSVKYQGKQHLLMRDTELLLAYTGEELHESNVRMVGDRVLVRIKAPPKGDASTSSGVLIAQSATRSMRATIGVVEKVGPGRTSSSGQTMPMYVEPGDRIKFKVSG